MPGSSAAVDAYQAAERLKAEAEQALNIDPQHSLGLAEQINGLSEQPRVRALGRLARADALRVLGRHAEADADYQTSAELFLGAGDRVGWARSRIGATVSARYTGTHTGLFAELDAARQILLDHGLWVRLARLESNLGVLLSGLGRADDALAAHERALSAVRHVSDASELLEAEVLGNLSLAYYELDDHARAEALHARMLAIFEREQQHEQLARAQRNYARLAAARGHYSKALSAVFPGRRALLVAGRINAAAHLGQVGVDCLLRLNRAAEAAELANEVLREFEATGAPIEQATTHLLRALAFARQSDTDAALLDLERAERLFGDLDWESGPAVVRLGRAVVLREAGRWADALAEANAVRDELRERGLVGRAAQADIVRAEALRGLGRQEAAAECAASALELVGTRALPWLSYHAWRVRGELAQRVGDVDAALSAFLEAVRCLEHVQGRILTEYRASFLADKVDVFEPTVDLLIEKGEVLRAFEFVERAKSRALIDALAGGLEIRVRPSNADQEVLARELTDLRRIHDAWLEAGDDDSRIADAERRIEQLLEELRLGGADDLERLSLLEGSVYLPQTHLDSTTALVEYFVSANDLLVFVVDQHAIRVARVPAVVPRLKQLQRALLLNLEAAAATIAARAALEPNARGLLQRLYAVLIEPVRPMLDGYQRLVCVPHGVLHHVPFAALHDGDRYLIEDFELVHAPSASSLAFCLRPRRHDGAHALVLGNSAGGALPGVIEEARTVAGLFGDQYFVEDEATMARLREQTADADVIHIAAHGVARPDAPVFSYLRLADGHLTALDCCELELDCALVTLSACESGRVAVAAGDEQIGLARAFLYAGARAVVHSLWRIDDRVTQMLMERFYTELRSGRGRAAALRIAQLEWLQAESSHPLLWAGLSLVGDWR